MQSFSLIPGKGETLPVLEASVQVTRPEIWKNLLQEGAALEVVCKVNLLQSRILLTNRNLGESLYHWQLRFDPLTRDYLLIKDGQALRHNDLHTLLSSFLEDMVLPLPAEHEPEPGQYLARLELSLIQSNVPAWLKKTLFFWSWNVAAPEVFEQDFTLPYAQEERP